MFNIKVITSISALLTGVSILFVDNPFNFINFFYTKIHFDYFSVILVLTTAITLLISLIIVDNKYRYANKKFLYIFFFFLPIIFGLVYSNNIITFFIFYELLLIPSYFLVKYSSPNRRSGIVANYFLLWTQFGSFLVLLGVFMYFNQSLEHSLINKLFIQPSTLATILIFFGFAVKVPLWPFHFWLSKTHVEANTGFSIFLSGILVKSAIFGLYKFIFLFSDSLNWFFLTVTIISILDASLKMCIQIDLKKLVAFSTIQEMGFMVILLLYPSNINYSILYVFVVFHTFISGLFFWYVDCIYRRLGTRVSYNVSGLSSLFPTLSILVIIGTYLFVGIPFTIKFSIEIHLLKLLMLYNLWLFLPIVVFANYLAIIFFFKTFISINFGSTQRVITPDLTKKEFLIASIFIVLILLLNFI